MRVLFALAFVMMIGAGCSTTSSEDIASKNGESKLKYEVQKSDEEWKKELSPEAYRVIREKGTERPFSGTYYLNKETGVYNCVGCGNPLFRSDSKFDSGCGWPSFWTPVDSNAVVETIDRSLGMVRTEITCAKCGAHLGHVFDDGPNPSGLRYCINSVSLDFEKGNQSTDTTKKKAEPKQ